MLVFCLRDVNSMEPCFGRRNLRKSHMKAAFYNENGAARDVLKTGERPDPAPGPGAVLVRIRFSGVNPSDTKTRQGQPGRPLEGGERIPHNDGAGDIVAVGEGVDAACIGERVWLHNTGFKRTLGTAAELLAVEYENVVPLPDSLSYADGACLGVPVLTAYHAVTLAGSVNGKVVLVAGGAGAVGNFAIQIAKALGATVITTVSGSEKAAAAKEAGADTVINYRDDDVAAIIDKVTGGQGVNHVVEVNLGANVPLYDSILAKGGSVAVYGSSATMVEIDSRMLRIRLGSLHFLNVYELPPETLAAAKHVLSEMLASKRIAPKVAKTYALDDIASAHEAVEQGTLIGNAIVEIG